MDIHNYRKPFHCRPRHIANGAPAFAIPNKLLENNDEIALAIRLITERKLFGMCYQLLLPEYFHSMPYDSGVFIRGLVQTNSILPNVTFPGDIDLLIIPYEGNSLLLSKSLVVELKAIRATFLKQGKSPNQFGFSQANALLEAGFPYVAVGHLVVSDKSPSTSWRQIGVTRIIDQVTGECEPIREAYADQLPNDLLGRAHGRLEKNCTNLAIGYFSAYLTDLTDEGIWCPYGSRTEWNCKTSKDVLDAIYDYYCRHAESFYETRRYG